MARSVNLKRACT